MESRRATYRRTSVDASPAAESDGEVGLALVPGRDGVAVTDGDDVVGSAGSELPYAQAVTAANTSAPVAHDLNPSRYFMRGSMVASRGSARGANDLLRAVRHIVWPHRKPVSSLWPQPLLPSAAPPLGVLPWPPSPSPLSCLLASTAASQRVLDPLMPVRSTPPLFRLHTDCRTRGLWMDQRT